MAAFCGSMPLALGMGVGSELRQPLAVAVVGGLVCLPGPHPLHHHATFEGPAPGSLLLRAIAPAATEPIPA